MEVAIIGAGLGGAALALALHQKSIPCRIYELRSADAGISPSGVSLAPNGCRILDSLGVLERIRPKCYQQKYYTVKNDKDETTEKFVLASEELYGYKIHRVYRRELLHAMRAMLEERNIPVLYDSKFERIVEETAEGVAFQVNGRIERATILIGADGIYSSVRKYLAPVDLEYTGLLSIYGHIPADNVEWPTADFEKACTIQGKPGAFFMVPEVADGSDLVVGKQFAYPEQERGAIDALAADKDQLCALFCKDYELWHGTAKSILKQVHAHKEKLLCWPFHKVPKLDNWASATGRVVILGDAAHAIPPSSGQGINQALEDVYTLSLLLHRLTPQMDLKRALDLWHSSRQARIEAVLKMTKETDIKRLPEAERLQMLREGKLKQPGEGRMLGENMAWLFLPNMDEDVTTWIKTVG
ncbi:kynurenine 3-monooxygenase [Neofusicoccum parvum]|nr:kynurenine 3-monooxygenase [Neofusicoccum parvum]